MKFSRGLRLFSFVLSLIFVICALPLGCFVSADEVRTFEDNCLKVSFTEKASWDTSMQLEVSVENTGDTKVNSWSICISYSEEVDIDSIWNASYTETEYGSFLLTPDSQITAIDAGNIVSFGLVTRASSTAELFPQECVISSVKEESIGEEDPLFEELTGFTYAVFADNAFTFCGWKSTIYGDVYAGSDISYQGSELYLHGTLESYTTIVADGNIICVDNQIAPSEQTSMPDWTGNLSAMDGVIRSQGDIVLTEDNIGENVIIWSEGGNIIISGSDITIDGILYAPNGTVEINVNQLTFAGRIICRDFFYRGSVLNITADNSDLWFLNDSEVMETTQMPIGNEDEDRDGDGLTEFLGVSYRLQSS